MGHTSKEDQRLKQKRK